MPRSSSIIRDRPSSHFPLIRGRGILFFNGPRRILCLFYDSRISPVDSGLADRCQTVFSKASPRVPRCNAVDRNLPGCLVDGGADTANDTGGTKRELVTYETFSVQILDVLSLLQSSPSVCYTCRSSPSGHHQEPADSESLFQSGSAKMIGLVRVEPAEARKGLGRFTSAGFSALPASLAGGSLCSCA